ncbi:Alpha/Beta hydrolase protein, partial [Blyttiomyces helicus]
MSAEGITVTQVAAASDNGPAVFKSEQWVKATDGTELYHAQWDVPTTTPLIATVAVVHGVGEHVSRYNHVFVSFARAGIRVRGFDQRGFGHTGRRGGILGHNDGIETTMKDIADVVTRVRVGVEDKPTFVFGHSMGGGLALRFVGTQREGVAGAVISAPLISLGKSTSVPAIQYYAMRGLAALLGTLVLKQGVDANELSHDPAEVKAYQEDPFVHPYISLGTARDIVVNGDTILTKNFVNYSLPIVIAHGTKDTLTS